MDSRRSPARSATPALAALLPLALLLGACAGTGDSAFDSEERVGIEIRSDHPDADNLVVSVVSSTGVRRRLGLLNASGDGDFSFDPPAIPEEFRLVAETGTRTVATSDPFTVTRLGTTVRWDMDVGRVQILD